MIRDEARLELVDLLLDRVRQDNFPSLTEMRVIEEMLTPQVLSDYIEVLLDKIRADRYPSLTMIRKVQQLSAALPVRE